MIHRSSNPRLKRVQRGVRVQYVLHDRPDVIVTAPMTNAEAREWKRAYDALTAQEAREIVNFRTSTVRDRSGGSLDARSRDLPRRPRQSGNPDPLVRAYHALSTFGSSEAGQRLSDGDWVLLLNAQKSLAKLLDRLGR